MARVRLVHWDPDEASSLNELLSGAGFAVDYEPYASASMRKWRTNPPDVFVINLSRRPAHGREIAIHLRQSPKTRHIPIIFCEGEREKVELIRHILPDASFCSRARLIATLKTARPIETPLRPVDMMNRFGSRTTAQKLGIQEASTVALLNAPRNVYAVLGALPDSVQFVEEGAKVTICFVHSADALREDISRVRGEAAKTKLWIAWRKRAARNWDGVSGEIVRETGIDLGLVDYKICSLNETWSAMAFARRKG